MRWLARNVRNGRLLLVVVLLLAVNSAVVAGFAAANYFYVGNSLLHPVLGVLAAILFAIYVIQHRGSFANAIGGSLVLLAIVAAVFGGLLAVVGMTSRHRLATDVHVAFAVAALFLALVYLRRRTSASHAGVPGVSAHRAWMWSALVMAAALLIFAGAAFVHHFFPNQEFIIRNPSTAPLTMAQEGGGPHSLVWPSSAQVYNGKLGKPLPQSYFLTSESCEPCHSDIYHQWEHSMHHYASFNNQWYRKTIEYMQDTVGVKRSMWCGGCHDQALSFTGYMEKYPIRKIENTPAGQAGLGCVSCHSVYHVGSTMGQADFIFKYPTLAKYVGGGNGLLNALAYYDVLLDPKAHKSVFFKPFIYERAQQAEFCSTCHKVHQDVPVNQYRWARGFDEYDNWQASGTDWLGARSFYYPPKPEECVDCHMPLVRSHDFGNINGFVRSHRFAAAETAVPTAYGDASQIAADEKFLKGALSVDIFALAEEPSANAFGGATLRIGSAAGPQLSTNFANGEETAHGMMASVLTLTPPAKLEAPLGAVPAVLHRGETARVEVVVRNLKVGHFFPGGTIDDYDCWLELKAQDNRGHVIFWSGEVADNGRGPVDPGAHFYGSLQVDSHGNRINKRNTWLTRAVVYTRLVPPGATDVAHYRLEIPQDCGDRITITAKLNYRKFAWWYTQWAFAGVLDPKNPHYGPIHNFDDSRWEFDKNVSGVSAKYQRIPNVPIVMIAEQSRTIPVEGHGAPPAFAADVVLRKQDMIRWNDYGIGLLLQGDLKGAERAFHNVVTIDPSYANGWVNVARAMIQEGNTDAAKPLLVKALNLSPRLGSAHYFYGLALKADGDYPAAYEQFADAAARYPEDRVVRNQMGRMLFLERKYGPALAEYQKTISIDPEDLEAHYNMMLCYMGLGNGKLADREKTLYLRFKANEAARSITGPYFLSHPDANNEAQPIHEHVTIPLAEIDHPPASWYTPYLAQVHEKAVAADRREPPGYTAGAGWSQGGGQSR